MSIKILHRFLEIAVNGLDLFLFSGEVGKSRFDLPLVAQQGAHQIGLFVGLQHSLVQISVSQVFLDFIYIVGVVLDLCELNGVIDDCGAFLIKLLYEIKVKQLIGVANQLLIG